MIQLLNPIPGSPIYKKAVKDSLIEIDNLSLYDLEHCVMPTKTSHAPSARRVDRLGFSILLRQTGANRPDFERLQLAVREDEVSLLQEQRREV